MVSERRKSRLRGASKLGCTVIILAIALAGYLLYPVGRAYFNNWQLLDEMRTAARAASGIDDTTIRRRVLDRIRELGLPDEAVRNLRVRRTSSPRQILVTTKYEIQFDFMLGKYRYTFEPSARYVL